MKILIVDDSKVESTVLATYVRHIGGAPVCAHDGASALELFSSEAPDMVLLDVVLPDISGHEVARRIRALEQGGNWTPIIFVTSKIRDEDVEQAIGAGGDDYIYKPVSQVLLTAKIRAMHRIVQMRSSLVVLARKLDTANQELLRLSSSDGLTGLPNRRFFDETIEREWRRCLRGAKEMALVMCDVDHFKPYNDAYGHLAGDVCLRKVAGALRQALDRGGDAVARYGGEEFVFILPETTVGGALIVAERARHAVMALGMPHAESSYGVVTVSLGVATMVPDAGTDSSLLIQAADRALYQAKAAGRNCVFRLHPADNPT